MVEGRRVHRQRSLLGTLVIFALCFSQLNCAYQADQLQDLLHASKIIQDESSLENAFDVLKQEKQLQDEQLIKGINLNQTDITPQFDEDEDMNLDLDLSVPKPDETVNKREESNILNNEREVKQTERFRLPQDAINMVEMESIPISRFRQNQDRLKKEAEKRNGSKIEDALNEKEVDLSDIIPIDETSFASDNDYENREMVNKIRQNQYSIQQSQEEIERRQREINEHRFVTDDFQKQGENDLNDELKKIVNPSLLKDVLQNDKEKERSEMFAKLEKEQQEREKSAYSKTLEIEEEERIKEQKIKRDMLLANQRDRQVIEEIRKKKEEEERVLQMHLAEQARIKAQEEEEERQRQAEEVERERKQAEERARESERRQKLYEQLQAQRAAEEAEKERKEQEEIDAQQNAKLQAEAEAKRQADLQAQQAEQTAQQAQLDADTEAQREAELQAQAEALKKYEQDQQQQEDKLKQQEEETKRQEEELKRQEEEAQRQQQQAEEEYQRQQQQIADEQEKLAKEQQKLEEEERSIEQEEESQQQSEEQTENEEQQPEESHEQSEEQQPENEQSEHHSDEHHSEEQHSEEHHSEEQHSEQHNEESHQESEEGETNQQDAQTNVQTQSLKDIEDQKRQYLREQKQKAQELKNSNNVNEAPAQPQVNQAAPQQADAPVMTTTNPTQDVQGNGNSQIPDQTLSQEEQVDELNDENSEFVTQIDEFGVPFTFRRTSRKIPLVLPGHINDSSSQMAGMNLQTKIINESGHHLNKKQISEQKKIAQQFKFVSSSQTNPDGATIESKASSPTDSSSLVTNVAVLCSDKNKAQSKSVQHACELCEVGEVFQLTEDNWFKIGLAHNHKKEYQDLLNTVNTVFGKLNLIAGFSKHGDICLSSDQLFSPVSIDTALKVFTNHSLKDYQLKTKQVVEFQTQHQVNEVSFKTSFNKAKKNGEEVLVPEYDQFMMIIEGSFFKKIDSSTNLNILNVVFLQTKLTTFYFGQISINSYSTKVHFQHDEDDRDHDSINIVTDLPNESITFQRQAFKMFNQDNLQNIIQNMQIPRGVQSIENVKVSSMLITLNLQNNTFQIIMNLEEIVDFSLSLNLDLKDCTGWVIVRKDAESNQYFLDSNNLICQSDQFPNYSRVHIKKTNSNCYYFVRFADDEYLFHQINQDVFQKILDTDVPDTIFEDSLKGLVDFNLTYLHELTVEIYFEPKIIYDARANVGSKELKTIGNFQAKFTRINGKMNTFSSFTFGEENLSDLISLENSDLDSTKAQSLYVFFSEQEVNTKDMPYLSVGSFGPHEQTVWNEGVYLQYVFDLKDEGCFICELLNKHNVKVNDLHIKGYYKNSEVILIGSIEQEIQIADPIKLDNILLYLPISLSGRTIVDDSNLGKAELLSQLQYGRFYLSSEFNLSVQESTHFRFLGILSEQQDKQAYLIGEAPQPWSNAFGQDNLLLSKIMFKGNLNEKNFRVQSYTINTLSMFGDNCFVELVGDTVPRFDTNKCFFGNSQIKINHKDFSQNVLVSYINQISSQNILQVLLGYSQAEFTTQVSKPISSMAFPKGLAISYAKSILKDDNGHIHSPKGYTLTGYAELLGLKGHVVLNINQNKYMLGIFKFDELTIAGGNVVIVETEGGHDNDIILRLKKDSNQLGDANQVYFNPKAFIFNKQRNIQVAISKDTGFTIDVLDKFFGSEDDIAIRLSAPYNQDIKQTQFRMAAMFTSIHIKRINALLLQQTKEWIEQTSQLFVDLAQRVSEVQKDLIVINKQLCDRDTCPFHQQCIGTPRSECVKYHQKQVCTAETNICLEEKVVCEQEQKICSETAVTCNKFNEEDPTVCEEYEENCVEEITVCNKYTSQCLSDEIKICTKNSYVDDLERCIERQMVCDIQSVQDTNCQEECDRKKEDFELKSIIFDKFTNALNNFQKRNFKFSQMQNYAAENSDSFISILDAKFQQDLTEFVNDQQLQIDFNIQSFTILENVGRDIQTYVIDQYDFRNEEQMIHRLFKQIQQNWVTKYSLDDVLITSESPIILHDILNKIVELAEKDSECEEMQVLLQLDAKKFTKKATTNNSKAKNNNNNKKK